MTDRGDTPVVVRTPDQRLRIFVSSTLRELAPERAAVRQAILRLRLIPVMFESGARPHPPQRVYRAYLAQSHVFVGIYFRSYGWVAPGMQVSGLEDEYRLSQALPRLIYIKTPAPGREAPLERLLERIKTESSGSYKLFQSEDELRELVENDLILLLTEYFETARNEARAEDGRADRPPFHVPIARNPLIGREREIEAARSLLCREDVAMVTLTGPGGTGKSRLGLEIALEVRDQFADGVHLVALESVRDPELVIPTIATSLGVAETAGGPPLLEELKKRLCDKRVLLLLDNFEQVLAAGPRVGELLEACEGLKVLVTSRAPLRLRAEKELPVSPLAVPPLRAVGPMDSLSQYSAVRLFIERARGVKPDFEVTNQNAPAVAEICHRLDGLPLAIELAAARIKILSPQALLARLEHRFEVLRDGTRDLPDRQHTLYGAIDWSYNLLDAGARLLFRRLSVFVGGCTLEAAEAVCGPPGPQEADAFSGLESLVDNSLLRLEEETDGVPRIGMMETIREFAGRLLAESGEADKILESHAEYYLRLAERADFERYTPPESWHGRLGTELDNMRAAMATSLKACARERALRIAMALYRYWGPHGGWREGLEWLERGLAGSGPIPDAVRAMALIRSGRLKSELGDQRQGIAALESSVSLWEKIGDQAGLALALHNLGIVYRDAGDYDRSTRASERALHIRRSHRDHETHATLMSLALGSAEQGNSERAMALFAESLALARVEGDDDHAAWALINLAELSADRTDFALAETSCRQAMQILKRHGGESVDALVLGVEGYVALKRGEYGQAATRMSAAIRALHALGNRKYAILNLERLATAAEGQHQLARAAQFLAAGENLRRTLGVPRAPAQQAKVEQLRALLHGRLGEAEFDAAWTAGCAMSLDQAIAFASEGTTRDPARLDGSAQAVGGP